MPSPRRILVTGATGYVGRRLVPRLLERGHTLRLLVRDPRRVRDAAWADRVEVVAADLLDPTALPDAFEGVDVAVYLVHSLQTGHRFPELDRRAAMHFAAAARHLDHVVYLGGLQPHDGAPSRHLASRAEVGRILAASTPVTEIRAGPIIGSGSRSFEMIRYLTERLPVMVVPRCFRNRIQPIAIRDVLAYLVAAIEGRPAGAVDVGGADRPTFQEMLQTYATVRRLPRAVVTFPLPFAPHLAAHWVHLVTPIPYELASPLLEGLATPAVADPVPARTLFPGVEPISYRRAVELALERIEQGRIESHWSGALGAGPTYELADWEGLNREVRSLSVRAPPDVVFRVFAGLGGQTGWLAWRWAWQARGFLDRLVGGPGLRRGRRHPEELLVGEAVDFWRVEEVEAPRFVRLRAEMRLPGRAWLQWEALPEPAGCRLVQTAAFGPRGLWGALYWYILYPLHGRIFSALARAIAVRAEALAAVGRPPGPSGAIA